MTCERFPATLAFERYRDLCITVQNGQALVIDSERHGAFHISVHTDHKLGDTFSLIGGINTFVIEAFLSRTNRVKSQG
ncbi:hypothetical protein D3C72_1930390 [compost metagenome]